MLQKLTNDVVYSNRKLRAKYDGVFAAEESKNKHEFQDCGKITRVNKTLPKGF